MHADSATITAPIPAATEGSWLKGPVPFRIAALVILALTLPVIAWSEWFPLDLPEIYKSGAEFSHSLQAIFNPYNGSGRYFPTYYVLNGIQYLLFHDAVAPYFLVQGLELLATALILGKLLRDMTGSRWLGALLVATIYLNTPMAENLSTLGKSETVQFLLVAWILFIFYRSRLRGPSAWRAGAAISVLFLLALWMKETTVVVLVFAGAGLMFSLGARAVPRFRAAPPDAGSYLRLGGALLAGLLLSRIPYLLYQNTIKGSRYTDYAVTPRLVLDNLHFYFQQQPDVVVFAVLALVLMLLAVRHCGPGRSVKQPADTDTDTLVFVLAAGSMAGAHFLGFQLWRWPMNYYMQVPAALFQLCTLYGAFVLHRAGVLPRWGRRTVVALAGLALAWGAAAEVYFISAQIAYSRVYTDALRQVKQLVPGDARLVIENFPSFSEQAYTTQLLMRDQLHAPTKVIGVAEALDVTQPSPELLKLYNVTASDLAGSPTKILRRGDYLLTLTGSALGHWMVRGVGPFVRQDSAFGKLGAELQPVAQRSMATPVLVLHHGTLKPSLERVVFGYQLFKVTDNQPKTTWTGRYEDGWVGEHAALVVEPSYGQPVTFSITAMSYVVPLTIRITRDGKLFKEVQVTAPGPVTVEAGPAVEARTTFGLELSRSFVPKEVGINDDPRHLSAQVSLVAAAKRP